MNTTHRILRKALWSASDCVGAFQLHKAVTWSPHSKAASAHFHSLTGCANPQSGVVFFVVKTADRFFHKKVAHIGCDWRRGLMKGKIWNRTDH